MSPRPQRLIGRFLITTFVLNCFTGFSPALMTAHAQRKKVIVVNAEQPNLWTLEQAHYLLAQMHRRNLDLKAKSLEELDPNEIAGQRFDVMRMLVEFGATFNQADLASNRMLSANQTFNAERRQQLLTERDGLRRESVRLAGEIEELETEKANTEDEDAKTVLDARIAAKNTRLTRVDKEIETLNGELGTLNAPSGTLTATTGGATFDASKLPKSDFDEAFKEAARKQIEKFNESPQLNASLRLDNFLQMQYEIISKQLALLRDELGPGERLVFLELPQTVNATHHESERKWAQSWWKIAGYTHRVRVNEVAPTPTPTPLVFVYHPVTTMKDIDSIMRGEPIEVSLAKPPEPCPQASATPIPYEGPDNTSVVLFTDGPTLKASEEPSPAIIKVSDVPGVVTKVTVTLNGLRHPMPDDLDLLLVGPQGQNAIIMSDVGGDQPANGLDITLDDGPANPELPDDGPLHSGTYKPTNKTGGDDKFPKGVPPSLGGSPLSVFNGTDPNGTWKLYIMDDSGEVEGSLSSGWTLNLTTRCDEPKVPKQAQYQDEFVNLGDMSLTRAGITPSTVTPSTRSALEGYVNANHTEISHRMVRAVELIPRQGSLNVNDMKLNVKAGALNVVLSTLFGFGSRLSVQRQREQFSQFVQQELYSSAFGKGSTEFGWTFTPMPGTDRIMSGVRTTYAVVVVPETATSLVLEANGCYFPRSYYPPNDFRDTKDARWNVPDRTSRNCGGGDSDANPTKLFVVPIPSARVEGGNEFWIERVNFRPVGKGKQTVIAISGKNFSPQTGVLVNGVPLLQSIGLAQPLIIDDSEAGRRATDELKDAEITGRVERVDTEKIIFSLRMPPDFVGTPTITLVAPGRATDINEFDLFINRSMTRSKLSEFKPAMFGFTRPDSFRIDGVKLFRNNAGRLIAQVSGAGFGKSDSDPNSNSGSTALSHVLVNGSEAKADVKSPSLLTVEFDAPTDDTIKITLVSANKDPAKNETVESDGVANPAFRLSVAEVEVVTYEAGEDEEGPDTILVKIKGTGFTDSLTATFADKVFPVAVKSATEAVFTMPDPKGAAIITLDDGRGHKAKVVVARGPKKPQP